MPTSVLAAQGPVAPAPVPPITDVALRDGGTLVGQIVNAQNIAQAKTRVSVQNPQNQEIAAAVTDQQGNFAIQGLRGGVYQIVTPQTRGVYRLWMPGMAPPAAQQGVLLVSSDDAIRGAAPGPGGGLKGFLTNPLVIGAAVATAIAVPIAIHNSGHGTPSSP
jgi:hypothetical protein